MNMSRTIFYFSILLFHTILPLVDPSDEDLLADKADLPAIENLPQSHKNSIQKYIQDDPSLKEALKAFFQIGVATGIATGIATGFEAGYINRTFEHFFIMFDCAIQHGKATLDVFKDYENIYSKCESNQETMLEVDFPIDIFDLIRDNDQWIQEYEIKKNSNGYLTTPTITINPNNEPDLDRSIKVLSDVRKQLRHWYCIVNYTAPSPTKSPKNSKFPSETPSATPPFILRLQKQLKEIQRLNSDKYRSTHEIFLRFSALCGRSHKMFCTFHRKLLKHIMKSAQTNKTAQFSDILFYYVPSWIITSEQQLFFNVVRRTLYPTFPPIKNITLWNANPKGRNVTLIPYDDSKFCNQVFEKEAPKETLPFIKDCTIPLYES